MFEKTKAIVASLTLTGMMVAPTVAHHAAVGYLEVERRFIAKAQKSKLAWLEMIGLQPKVQEHDIDSLIDMAADEYGIPRPIFHALVEQESSKDPSKRGAAGEASLAQVMAYHYKTCGLKHPGKLWEELTNLRCGALILSQNLAKYKNMKDALATYNAGSPSSKKGQQYAEKVMAIAFEKYL